MKNIKYVHILISVILIFINIGFIRFDEPTEPVSASTELKYSSVCPCFGLGSISLSVQLDKDTYQVGEPISITAQVDNQSNKTVRAIRVKLLQVWEQRNFFSRTNINMINSAEVQASGSFHWSGCLQVPQTTYTMDNGMIKVSYVLKVTVVVNGARNVKILLPIKIACPDLSQLFGGLSKQF